MWGQIELVKKYIATIERRKKDVLRFSDDELKKLSDMYKQNDLRIIIVEDFEDDTAFVVSNKEMDCRFEFNFLDIATLRIYFGGV